MCGIAGSLGRPGPVPGLVRALRHRGPDQEGLAQDGELAVGAARLAIHGGRAGDMPLRSRSGRTLLAFNGEVFNHRELYPIPEGGSDASGLPDLLESEGPAALRRIRGPFALVAADLESRTLLAARDEIGVRPLFLHEGPDHATAASEVGPLRAAFGLDRLDDLAVDHLIAFQFWPRARTPWEGLDQLVPGTWRRFRRDALGGIRSESGALEFEGGGGGCGEALAEAFRLQSDAARRTAVLLSGGLDSSAVAAGLAAAGRPADLAAVGWFPGAPGAFDERPHARAVAAELGLRLLEVPIEAGAFASAWPKIVRALGAPLAGPGAASQWVLADALAREGVRIVFSGQGGDELFGGYERHRVLQQIDAGGEAAPARGYEALAPPRGRDPIRHLLFRGAELLPFLEPSRRDGVLRAARSALPADGPARAERTLAFECDVLLPGLLAVDDRAAAAFGMEGRVPLLDPALVRAARAVPLATKSPPESPRRLFRALLDPVLPAAARARTDKMGFPVPLDAWFEGPLRPMIGGLLDSPALRALGFGRGLPGALRERTLSARALWFLGSAALGFEGAHAAAEASASASAP